MCCRKTASILAEILSSPSRLLLFCTLVLLLAFQEQFYFAEGSRNGRILKQSTESNQERPIASEINVTNAFSFRQALLQQNITTINIAGDLRLNTSVWENGTDNNPETGVKISRNLNIITLPSLDKQRIIYLDYMINRIVVDTDVTLTINGLVFKEVNKIAERSIGIPFIHYSNRSTVSIINSQFQFAIDSVGGNTLEASRSVLMSRRIPDGYEDWKPFVSVVSREQCEENRLRKVSCKDGALFVRQVASVVTPFNAMGHATGKAVFLIWNALLDAKDAHRFPELNPVSTNISSAIELRRAMQNKRIATIYIMRDIEITEDDFTDEERIPISRDITIQTSPEINRTCIIWLNFIEDAVEAGRSIKIRAYNLGFAGVSRRPEVQDRIPFFTFRDRASLILKNVTSEFAVDANERSSIRQLPFLWYGAAVQSETEDDGNIVRTVENEWCLADGRIECPIGALLITRGTRYFGVQEDRVVVGQYFIESENVLVKAIDITKPIPRFSPRPGRRSRTPATRMIDEEDQTSNSTTRADGSSTESANEDDEEEEDSDDPRDTGPWILIYLLVAAAGVLSVSLLIVTFYRRREQRRSVSPKELKTELAAAHEDDGLREHQAIARELLGDVKLGSLLGCGSFGRVYKATWSGAQVAVKVILHQEDEEEVTQEAMFSLSLRHPNVVQTYHYAVRALESSPTSVHENPQGGGGGGGEIKTDPKNSTSTPQGRHQGMGIPSSWSKTSQSGESAQRSGGGGGGGITTETVRSKGTTTAGTSTTRDGSRYDDDDDDESWMEMWLIQEYCELGSVGRQNTLRLNSQNSVWGGRRGDLVAILDTCKDVARGMKYLHDNGVVHGDLKCDNLLLQGSHASSKGFVAKVADFGLSRRLVHVTHLSTKSFGTITHMPPELLLEGHLSPRVDVYSFGIIMWELWSGETPFRNMRYAEVMRAIVVDDRRPEYDGDAPPEYVSLSIRCWDKDPHGRPTFDQVLEELDDLMKLLIPDETYTTDTSRGRSTVTSPKRGKNH